MKKRPFAQKPALVTETSLDPEAFCSEKTQEHGDLRQNGSVFSVRKAIVLYSL